MKALLTSLQQMGRALMLPIAVLPVAGLLLRLGQPDVLDLAPMAAAGDAIFSNLGLLFAIGVAVGLARENHGAAGLASVVGYLVTTKGAEVLIPIPPDVVAGLSDQASALAAAAYKAKELAKLSVPAGIISGVLGGVFYNRFGDIRMPSYLAFFGGRRFVPIVSGVAGLALAALFGWGWPVLETGMDGLSRSVLGAGELGLFAYGVLNRVLIVTGLHHIINNLAWFLVGDYNGVTGDLKRFFAGDPAAGAFMSGFFPVMMFGLPAACLAMYHTARPEKRAAVGGLLGSMALTTFLTGVTEPIEFSFMFLAPVLYAVHAVLTGAAMVLMHALNVHLGFSFSAGLFDYVLNFGRATNPWRLVPIGLAYFALYYGVFRYVIQRFDLKTPGRDIDDVLEEHAPGAEGDAGRARGFIEALGGAANLVTVDACTTRLRLVVASQEPINVDKLKGLGARGVVRPSANALQVVLGPIADQVAGDIRAALHSMGTSSAGTAKGAADVARGASVLGVGGLGRHLPIGDKAALGGGAGREHRLMANEGSGSVPYGATAVAPAVASSSTSAITPSGVPANLPPTSAGAAFSEPAALDLARRLVVAMGGATNLRDSAVFSTRLRLTVRNGSVVDEGALNALGLRGIARPAADTLHLLIGPNAAATQAALAALTGR